MADILFVHNNFPGQFGFLARALLAQGHRCAAIKHVTDYSPAIPGVAVAKWSTKRGTTKSVFELAIRAETDLIRGYAATRPALELQKKGLDPAVIVGHPGWGETLFLRQIFPEAAQILYGEFYYSRGGDGGFDPEFGEFTFLHHLKTHAKNATGALAYMDASRIVCPTPFQASRFPEILRHRIEIIHEGIDVTAVRPDPAATFRLTNGRVLSRAKPVITFINRQFEPLRGFHIFLRALPAVLEAVPEAEVLLIGGDDAGGYGQPAPKGTTWKAHYLAEVRDRLDMRRVHFTGRVPHGQMLAALSLSAAHVYYTYPFVLSWSLLEAMASECLIIGSDTPPVRDVIEHGVNGRLLDFFDVTALSEALIAACRSPDQHGPLRKAARETIVRRFDRNSVCLPAWLRLIEEVRRK